MPFLTLLIFILFAPGFCRKLSLVTTAWMRSRKPLSVPANSLLVLSMLGRSLLFSWLFLSVVSRSVSGGHFTFFFFFALTSFQSPTDTSFAQAS